jgi:hypothetical protein
MAKPSWTRPSFRVTSDIATMLDPSDIRGKRGVKVSRLLTGRFCKDRREIETFHYF